MDYCNLNDQNNKFHPSEKVLVYCLDHSKDITRKAAIYTLYKSSDIKRKSYSKSQCNNCMVSKYCQISGKN